MIPFWSLLDAHVSLKKLQFGLFHVDVLHTTTTKYTKMRAARAARRARAARAARCWRCCDSSRRCFKKVQGVIHDFISVFDCSLLELRSS